MSCLLTHPQTKVKAKSVLNKSSEYAAKHMFDDKEDTCWNSDQGCPQHILIDFEKPVHIEKIRIMFQGGFVGQDCLVEGSLELGKLELLSTLDNIADNNDLQSFPIDSSKEIRFFKLTFNSSTDFYGRITIYRLEAFGTS